MIEMIFVAAIAGATIAFELVQTRILSTLYYNHVVYLTVTIALMGFGISGVAISLLGRNLAVQAKKLAAYCAAGFAISVLACMYTASRIPSALPSLSPIAKLFLSYLILIVPFLLSGAALGLIFMAGGRRIHRLYASDLVASAAAVLAFCLLLTPLGADAFVWLCIAVPAAAFLLLGHQVAVPRLIMGAVLAVLATALVALPESLVGKHPETYKTAGVFYSPDWTSEELLATRWAMTAKIDVWSDTSRDLISGKPLGHPPPYRVITQDNDAHTIIPGPEDRRTVFEIAGRGEPFEPLAVLYFLVQAPEQVLVIGAGGGKDVVTARAYGAKGIDAVELNPATVDVVSSDLLDYAEWPAWDEVNLLVDEGRRFVRTSKKAYDAIIMSGVDTFAALSSGAYVLSENYLYTVEAMKDYLSHLRPNGVLGIFRWFFPQPREDLRLANLYLQAAEELGVTDPQRSIMVIVRDGWAATLIKNGSFTPEEVTIALDKVNAAEGFSFLYVPKVFPSSDQAAVEQRAFSKMETELRAAREAYTGLITASSAAERRNFEEDYIYNITAVYDDRPFFFEYFKPGYVESSDSEWWSKGGLADQITSLRGNAVHYTIHFLLFIMSAAMVLTIVVPLLIFNRRGLQIERGFSIAMYFSALGFGFMLVEIGLMQKLTLYLGHPMYSIAVVLAGMLLFAGIGAFTSERWTLSDGRKIAVGMLGAAVTVGAWVVLGQPALSATAGWPLASRVALTLVTLAPLAMFMGIPFATGLHYVGRRHAAFIPWAWGLNGITSVLGSVAAILIAMSAGFTTVLLAGAAAYAVGLLMFLFHRRSAFWHAAERLAQ